MRIRSHLSFANVMATIAVFVALGGGAIAATQSKSAKTKPRWAVVNASGDLVRGRGATRAKQLFGPQVLGSYQVKFNRNLTGCGLVATLGRVNSAPLDPEPGEVGVAYRNGHADSVYVKTRRSDGEHANRSFHLAVLC
jgi:hypothetical protein